MTVRDRLRTIGLRLNELANYVEVSRPTLYKYLELYEAGDHSSIDKKTHDLFSYIEETKGLTKPVLTDYLFNNYVRVSTEDSKDELGLKITNLLNSKKTIDKKKIELIRKIVDLDSLDDFKKGIE